MSPRIVVISPPTMTSVPVAGPYSGAAAGPCAAPSPGADPGGKRDEGPHRYPGGGTFGPGTDEYKADIQSWLGLANAYIDLGCWRGFT